MVNAGISGNTSADGLARLDRDVIARQPDLVVVMFGINDMSRSTAPADYRSNLEEIARQLSGAGAEVVLCTPTFSERLGAHPLETQQAYREMVREVAREDSLAVADTHAAFASLRAENPDAYVLAMSDAVHPNMNGHKLIAETVARAITGGRVSLAHVPPDIQMAQVLAKKRDGGAIRVVAMPPYDSMLSEALAALPGPPAELEVIPWPTSVSVTEMEEWAKSNVRKLKPDLVVVAVPPDASALDRRAYIASYEWILNWSLDFGPGTWDCLPVLPSVIDPDLSPQELERGEIARTLIAGKDLRPLQRAPGDDGSAQEILTRFLLEQYQRWSNAEQAGEQGPG